MLHFKFCFVNVAKNSWFVNANRGSLTWTKFANSDSNHLPLVLWGGFVANFVNVNEPLI
jgi:hypothetical protein